MSGVQRLYGAAVRVMPTIDSNPVFAAFKRRIAAEDHIFFDSADQSFSSLSLSFDDEMMLPHGNRTIPKGIHGYGLQFYLALLVDQIHHAAGG